MPQHRRGRWHGLVYVAVPRSRRLVAIAARATSRPPRDLCRNAHVSASRPFGLYAHEIDPFVRKLKSALAARCCRPFCIAIDGTLLKLQSEDGARTFDALAVRPSSALAAVVDAADEALGAFGRGTATPSGASTFPSRRATTTTTTVRGRATARTRPRTRTRTPAATSSTWTSIL